MPDPLLLARAQFGLNIAFHILFPSITIALGWFLLYLVFERTGPARTGSSAPTDCGSRCLPLPLAWAWCRV
jgi:hypothetical protein